MKKLLIIIGLTLIIIANAEAAPTFLGTVGSETGMTYSGLYADGTAYSYTVYDRSRDVDTYVAASGGYYNNIDTDVNDTDATDDFTGFYIGTVSGNDGQEDITNLINLFLNDDIFEITEYGKYDVDTKLYTGEIKLITYNGHFALFGSNFSNLIL